ncbi:Lrp/AsnC family transcriptional regulator [Litorilituus lipolyticus]|uniref:Siroheme decarboxylase NirL subunit n=1 Tax=Litorilituus lipolyticus TaxID=2491017 RepID=A0A502L3Q4_9GAMM|nr:Lrp/AsnC family transcriptional regulator [Litorilituus lipolyticus]TPH18598.1 Lrp/AsnC family transcriptional regulator [Litorilituus lipolyticus]
MAIHQSLPLDLKSNTLISQLQQDIINNFQRGLPLCEKPYQMMAEKLSTAEHSYIEVQIFEAIQGLDELNIISRIGPVFDHKKAGASTLAAIAVPEEELDKVAGIVNQFEQVNHNYGREHDYNLWFVVTASDPVALNNTITRIEALTGYSVLVLPMEASYHIDLAFSINITDQQSALRNSNHLDTEQAIATQTGVEKLSETQKSQLRNGIEKGLPKVLTPYAVLAEQINATEQQVHQQIALWLDEGLIRRFGLVIKHRSLGFDANAMVVWNVPNEDMDSIANRLAKCPEVSLCYQRPRREGWPYNLFCMIHGRDRDVVLKQIKQIRASLALTHIEHDVLFSFKAYKQNGAKYGRSKGRAHG